MNAHKEVPEDVVTVDSEVRLSDGRTGAEIRCSIVFPECAEAAVGRISVLAPLGAALLGHRTGERVAFDAPEGPRNCEILSVQQRPESSSG
ncbi:MAG: GreA/GreB family elongation factor [Phycisphaerales bacterium]|nr:GreA/GreB family elongation factor [Phycisphaerales bacterium]